MKINCYDTFTALQQAILGSVSATVIESIEDANKKAIMRDVLYHLDEDLAVIQHTLEQAGVVVHRPAADFDFGADFVTPFFRIKGARVPLSSSDIILAHADKLIITSGADRSRFFEQICYSKIFDYYSDSVIINMPMPRLSDDLYRDIDNQTDYFNNNEPLIDASNIQCYGRDIFITRSLSANQKGIDWMKKVIGPEYRFHVLPDHFSGHIDNVFNILRPGLVVSNHPREHLPEYFHSWNVIWSRKPQRPAPEFISNNVQDDDFSNTWLDINMISLDQDHVLITESMKDSDLVREIERYDITPVFVPMRYMHFTNQGLKCIIQDTVRQGSLEDYA